MDIEERRGLDETRRLLHVALIRARREEDIGAELAGTLVNALRYHHRDVLTTETLNAVCNALMGDPDAPALEAAIVGVTRELGDG